MIVLWVIIIGMTSPSFCDAEASDIIKDLQQKKDLEMLVVDILNMVTDQEEVTCVCYICDAVYLNVFEGPLFKRTLSVPYVMIVVTEYEDLLSPNYLTLQALRQTRKDGCNVYVILLANGHQATRLLRFGDRYRILDTRAKYIMLHDFRLFHSDLHYIWKRIVNVIFLRYHRKIVGLKKSNSWFDLSSVPFPNPIRSVLVPRRLDIWRDGRFHYSRQLFQDKTSDLRRETLNVVYLNHVPAVTVMATNVSSKISGVEIEILNTLAEKMNFQAKLYEPINADLHKWGQKQTNGSYSGLLGEMVNGKADVALGNLQYTPYHLELTDLTIPYISQCLTFLTPEALTDNSWKTLILPFKPQMWIAVLLVLLITGSIFYGLARSNMNLLNYQTTRHHTTKDGKSSLELKQNKNLNEEKPVGLYLFNEISNSVLYTFGMLLVVSLPKLPNGSSIRLLTGWYWLYCILLVVSYRASMTAILANPSPRVTIDTLKELVDSKITCGGWGGETKKFFVESLDEMSQKIGEKFEIMDDPDTAARQVAKGVAAYYDNEYFLKYLTVRKQYNMFKRDDANNTNINDEADNTEERSLHIMTDCVVNIPISIGLQKNSPLKPLADIYIRRIFEVGLVEKWLSDTMYPIRSAERDATEEIKALMNLKKLYGALLALLVGYILSGLCLICELCHWHFVVNRDPHFDKYAMDVYYSNKKNKKQ